MLIPHGSRLPAFLLWTAILTATGPAPVATASDPLAVAEKKLLIVAVRPELQLLAPFVAHKKKLLPTELVALEDILKGTQGADDAEKLKRYLYDRWKNDKVRYVLLVGDAEVIPVRYIAGKTLGPEFGEWNFLPTDLYYADLAKRDGSFENWNARTDGFHAGYYGELMGWEGKEAINQDEIDYLPEVAVGRWPVHDVTQLKTVVAKTIKYENHAIAGLPAVRRTAFVNGPNFVDARELMTTWAGRVEASTGIRPIRLLYKDKGKDYKTPAPNEADVERVLNGGVGMIFHIGHGSETSWDQCLDLSRLRTIRNAELPPVMFSIGCDTARFTPTPPGGAYRDEAGTQHKGADAGEKFAGPAPSPGNYQPRGLDKTGLGVEFLRAGPNGATAYIGCAVGAQGCGRYLMDGFLAQYNSHSEPRIGDVWTGAISYYYQAWDLKHIQPRDWSQVAIFDQGMGFQLLGDPSMRLPRSTTLPSNLLINGSFEDGIGVDNFLALNEGSTVIGGWTVTRGQIDYLGTHWKAADGGRSLDLHGSPGFGGISQEFDTVKGRRYRVTFALASSPKANPIVKHVGVAAAGKTVKFEFDATENSLSNMGWATKTWEFEAVSARTNLEIYTLETTDPVSGPALDDVKVVEVHAKK